MKIKHLKLYTEKLDEQKQFYTNVLNLKIEDESDKEFTIKIGNAQLSFIEEKGKYNYHFAINIPSNKIKEALEWLKARVDIQSMNGNEIIKFDNWNAESIYFYDAEYNILELIARKNLNINSESNFDQKKILSISEIGVPTRDIRSIYEFLNKNYGIEKYDCDINKFCAAGDEEGLFIIIDYNEKKWIPNMDDGNPSNFSIIFENGNLIELKYENEQFILYS